MQQLLLLQSQELVAGGRAGLTLLLPGATGVQVHARGSDPAAMQKLRLKVAATELKLGILPGETEFIPLQSRFWSPRTDLTLWQGTVVSCILHFLLWLRCCSDSIAAMFFFLLCSCSCADLVAVLLLVHCCC